MRNTPLIRDHIGLYKGENRKFDIEQHYLTNFCKPFEWNVKNITHDFL